jgi:Rieske Fe-S protein
MAKDDHEPKGEPSDPGRRRALGVLAVCTGATVCAGAAAPGVALVLASDSSDAGDGRWIRAIKLEQLSEGHPRKVPIVADARDAWTLAKDVELGSVWIVRKGSTVRVWSTVCPHLGCSIVATDAGFNCPCHSSDFSPDGDRVTGPVRRAMDTLDARIEDGWVSVNFKRFRVGSPDKVAVG